MAYQNFESMDGPVGQWLSSSPIEAKKTPVRLFPSKAGTPMEEGNIQPTTPRTRTRGLAFSQFLSNSLPADIVVACRDEAMGVLVFKATLFPRKPGGISGTEREYEWET